MPLDPLEHRLAADLVPQLDLLEHPLDDIAILDRLFG